MRLLFILIVCLWAGFVKAQEAEAPASQVQNEATQEVDQDGRTTERTYYNSGRLKTSTSYKDGKKDGYERMYYDNGQLKQEFFYTEGRLSYVGREYFADGKLAADAEPQTGLMNRYDEQTGRIIEKVPFINGKMEGTRLFYDAQGKKTGFQECQNSICGPRTDVSDSPWYRYVFSHPNVSFWLVRMPTSIVQTSRMFLQERSQSGLLRIQQMTPEDPQIRIIYAHNEETLPAYVQIEFPMENLQAIVEKEYSYAPRVIVWKLNGIPVWQRVWGDMGTKDEPLNKARVTETKDEENKRKRILVQSPDVTCPLFISFVVDDNDVVKTEDAALLYWNKQQATTLRRSVTWAFRGDGRIAFLYLQVPDKYLRIEYAYGAAMRMIGESWLENREGSETVQFDMSYMFKDDNYLSGQTLSVYDKDQPFYQGNSWDTIRQNYDEMPFANESIIKGRDIQE